MGKGSSFIDIEDFIVSNNLLPLGSLIFLLFCCYKAGWGWDNFRKRSKHWKRDQVSGRDKGLCKILFLP
jgi:SNF family Na+-dependent transporter